MSYEPAFTSEPHEAEPSEVAAEFLDACRPKLNVLETLRLQKLRVFEFRKKIAVPIGATVTPLLGFVDYWLLLLQRGNDDSAAGVSLMFVVGLWAWVSHPKRQYARAYKKDILPEIARLFGNFTYDMKGKIPMAHMEPSKIVPKHIAYKSEDFFKGTYKSVDIKFSEIELTQQSGKKTKTVFKGLAILLTQGTRRFHGHTILVRDQGKIGAWFKKQTSGLQRAGLLNPEFERLFDVFTTDQVEARYLIDPLIIENLKTLYREYSGDKMMVAFYEGHVLILIGSNKNHFEPASIYTPATSEGSLMAMKREIAQILSIIDRLSLYDPRKARE